MFFPLVKGMTPWLNDRKRVLSSSSPLISLSLEFSLLAAWLTPRARKTCPIHVTVVKQRRQMFLGFPSLGLNSSWGLTLIDSLSRVCLGVSGGDACVNLGKQPSPELYKGRRHIWEKDRWDNAHAILRWPWFPRDKDKKMCFLKGLEENNTLCFFCVASW